MSEEDNAECNKLLHLIGDFERISDHSMNIVGSVEEMNEYGCSHMAKHKVPRYFIIVKEFPMNAAGKILKYKMREDAAKRLGL